MAYEPEKIKQSHVFEAAKFAGTIKETLKQSTVYDVIIEGNAYPPKEIFRIAHRLATGSDPGIIYGGEQINKHFRLLGFDVIQKVIVWKLGCNWESGSPSFYDLIKTESIVLGVTQNPYKQGDLIIITEGFTVYAIAEVLENPVPITSVSKFEILERDFNVPFENWVAVAKAEWYIIPKSSVFKYKLRQGIRRVQKKEVLDKVFSLWEERINIIGDLIFHIKKYSDRPEEDWQYPCLVLIPRDETDENGYKTEFELCYYRTPNSRVRLGFLKILEGEKKITQLPTTFSNLPENFVSLGQTLTYYNNLIESLPTEYTQILKALNDLAFFAKEKTEIQKSPGFQNSLIKSSEAQSAFFNAQTIPLNKHQNQAFKFEFSCTIGDAINSHKVDFAFNDKKVIPNRFYCLIGKNGTGKTKFISSLANKLVDNSENGQFTPSRPFFSKIIASSFSYFDNFKTPNKTDNSYEFIGIRHNGAILSQEMATNNLWAAYKIITLDRVKKSLWLDAIKNALDISFLGFDLNDLDNLYSKSGFMERTNEIFSSGQKIIFQLITRAISSIEINSLLLLDEPETHLHPNIIVRLVSSLRLILDKFDSFCIIATHSPIIVQQIPSDYVRHFERNENTPLIFQPLIENFGENLSIISNSIFQVDEERELYKTILEDIAEGMTIDEIDSIFKGKLSLNARLFLQSILNTNA